MKIPDKPVLYIIIPCYNEQEVLLQTAPMFLDKLTQLTRQEKIAEDSRILFVNDGSKDKTWELFATLQSKISIISALHKVGTGDIRTLCWLVLWRQ